MFEVLKVVGVGVGVVGGVVALSAGQVTNLYKNYYLTIDQ